MLFPSHDPDAYDDVSAETPTDDYENHGDEWSRMIAAKRLVSADVSRVIPRRDWANNTLYTKYDSNDSILFTRNFFVMNSEYNIYKVLDNFGGANSTVEPTGTTNNAVIETSDGYKWKYMHTITAGEAFKHLTASWMPISNSTAVTANPLTGIYSIHVSQSRSGGSINSCICICVIARRCIGCQNDTV